MSRRVKQVAVAFVIVVAGSARPRPFPGMGERRMHMPRLR